MVSNILTRFLVLLSGKVVDFEGISEIVAASVMKVLLVFLLKYFALSSTSSHIYGGV